MVCVADAATGGITLVLVDCVMEDDVVLVEDDIVLATSLYSVVEAMVLMYVLGVPGAVATTSLVDVIIVN